MPLSTMLAGYFGEFQKGMRQLAPWQGLTERFELVVARLRSAYLVRWFGTGVPTVGITVKAVIVNSDELRARWLGIGADRDRRTGPPRANLLEPLLGTTGLLAGAFVMPFNALLLSPLVWRLFDSALVKIGAVVNWLIGGALFAALLPIGALAALGLPLMADTAIARSGFDLLGALAQMAVPFREFWAQVTGPRAAVRNTLLRLVLDLADAFAAAAIQFVGAVAEGVTRVAPMLVHVIAGLDRTIGAGLSIAAMLSFAISATITGLTLWWHGPGSPLAVIEHLAAMFPQLVGDLGRIVGRTGVRLAEILAPGILLATLALTLWLIDVLPFIRSQTADHPTVRWLRSFLASTSVFAAWRKRTTPAAKATATAPSSPGAASRVGRHVGMMILRATGMPPSAPTFDLPAPLAAPTPFPSAARIALGAAGTPNPFALTRTELAELGRWRRPPSVFGAEWRALRAEQADPARRARLMLAADYLQHLEPLLSRTATEAAAQRGTAFVPAIEDVLSRLDAALTPPRRHPTRLLDEPREIRPVIGRLRVHGDDGEEHRPRYEAFVATLRTGLDAAPYPVTATAGGRTR